MALFGYYTTDSLIDAIKKDGAVPVSNITFETSDIIRIANDEIDSTIVPLVLSVHEEFYVRSETVALTSNQSRYQIPYRAIGSKLRAVFLVDSSGNKHPMTRIEPENEHLFQNGMGSVYNRAFKLEGDEIVLIPSVGASITGSLEMIYFIKPNDLVADDEACDISSINTGTGVITVDDVPEGIEAGSYIDFIEAKPLHKTKGFDVLVTAVDQTLNTITVSAASLPSDLVAGDTIALAGQTKIPQIPTDLQSILTQAVIARILESLGDAQGFAAAEAKLEKKIQKALTVIDSRTEGNPQKILNSNSFLRRGKLGYRRFGGR